MKLPKHWPVCLMSIVFILVGVLPSTSLARNDAVPGIGWSLTVHAVRSVPDLQQVGWTDVAFQLAVKNTQVTTVALSTIQGDVVVVAKWQSNTYQGRFITSNGYLPSGFTALAEAEVTVPTGALHAVTFTLSLSGQGGSVLAPLTLKLRGPFAPLPRQALPSSHTLSLGQTYEVPQIAAVTPTTEIAGKFTPVAFTASLGSMSLADNAYVGLTGASGYPQDYSSMSSNWLLGIRWRNLSGQNAAIPFSFQLMTGYQIISLTPSSLPQAPLTSTNAVLPLPVLPTNQPIYLVVTYSSTAGIRSTVYRLKPPAKAQSWLEESQSAAIGNYAANGVTFTDSEHGWAVGAVGYVGTIISTKDGGATWTTQYSAPTTPPITLNSIAFSDSLHGIAVGEEPVTSSLGPPVLLYTANGGKTWTRSTAISNSAGSHITNLRGFQLQGAAFPDRKDGWAVGYGDTGPGPSDITLHSTDGGVTWMLQTNVAQQATKASFRLNGISFTDPQHGWMVGGQMFYGVILNTTDGGNTWKVQAQNLHLPNPNLNNLSSIIFPDAHDGWAAGPSGFLRTNDGGKTWTNLDSNLVNGRGATSLAFSTPRQGCATGPNSRTVLCTNDGGSTWTSIGSSGGTGVSFSKLDDAWVTSDSGAPLLHIVHVTAN